MAGKIGRSGPKRGNLNALISGARLERRRLVLGTLPPTMRGVQNEASEYRRLLEDAVRDKKGTISKPDERRINEAATSTMYAGILRWCLRHRLDSMDAKAIEANGRKQYEARLERDAAEEKLGIDIEHDADPWGAVDASPVPDNGSDLQDK